MYLVASPGTELYERLSLNSYLVSQGEALWQPLTAVFLHANFLHILFNMYVLYLFGNLVAPVLGPWRFLTLFLLSGVCGNLIWLALNFGGAGGVVGASGGVMGVLIAAAMVAPNEQFIMLFAPFPVKLKTMALVFIALDLLSELLAPLGSSIAYMAHIGGFLTGFLYMRFFCGFSVIWDPLSSLLGRGGRPSGWRVVAPPPPPPDSGDGRVTQAELDRILDKLSATGINSLSESEMETLRKAREQMKRP
jgi:membrane associated rhomboid family serine protease